MGKKKAPASLPPGVVSTQREVAAAFGVGVRTIKDWRSDGMPVTSDKLYNLLDVAAWKTARSVAAAGEDGGELTPAQQKQAELDKWDLRLKKAKAERAELDLRVQRGELLEREDVELGRVRRIIAVKQNFLALPQHVAATLAAISDPVEVQAVLERQVRAIVEQFEEGAPGGEEETDGV